MESSLIIRQFAAGEQEAYEGVAGITFRATSNPEVTAPENVVAKKIKNVLRCSGKTEWMKEAFTPKKKTKGDKPTADVPYDDFKKSSFRGKADSGFVDKHGLTGAIVEAYSRHHNLALKPDSFWQAILIQFAYYVNANAEALRNRIVDFHGKKCLKIKMGTMNDIHDLRAWIIDMADVQIPSNFTDPSLVEWITPSFTTTSSHDRLTAVATVMSAQQKFSGSQLGAGAVCGLPEVTLLGEVSDWETLRAKIDRLLEFELEGQNHIQIWHGLLAQILEQMIQSRSGSPDLHFWETIIKHEPNGSGEGPFSGWMSTFNVFTHKGQWQGNVQEELPWPVIAPDDLSRGMCKLPCHVQVEGIWHQCFMFAGLFRSDVLTNNTLAPRNDWKIMMRGKTVPDLNTPNVLKPKGAGKPKKSPRK